MKRLMLFLVLAILGMNWIRADTGFTAIVPESLPLYS